MPVAVFQSVKLLKTFNTEEAVVIMHCMALQITSSRAAVASLLAVLSRHTSQTSLVSSQSQPPASAGHPVTEQSALQSSSSGSTMPLSSSSSSSSGVGTKPISSSSSSVGTKPISSSSSTSCAGKASGGVSSSDSDRLRPQGGSASAEAAQAAATALQNLVLDKGAQSLVVDLQGVATVAKLLSAANWLLAARAAGEHAVAQ